MIGSDSDLIIRDGILRFVFLFFNVLLLFVCLQPYAVALS